MIELKVISKEGIPQALAKAERYRLLAQPVAAESICHDILVVDPENQPALVMLLLSLTDEFKDTGRAGAARAMAILPKIKSEYERTYYRGIICERQAVVQLKRGSVDSGYVAYDLLHEAMELFQAAQKIHPSGNDESILHWNVCARLIEAHRLTPPDNRRTGDVPGDF